MKLRHLFFLTLAVFLLSLTYPLLLNNIKRAPKINVSGISGIGALKFLNQYNKDIPAYLHTSSTWPHAYRNKAFSPLVHRPLYPFLGHLLARVFNIPCSFIFSPSNLKLDSYKAGKISASSRSMYVATFGSLLCINFLLLFFIFYFFNRTVLHFFNYKTAFYSTLLLGTSGIFIPYARQVGVALFGVFTVSFCLYMMYVIYRNSRLRAVHISLLGLATGFVLLGKNHASMYLVLLVFLLFHAGLPKFLLFLVSSLIPRFLWSFLLPVLDIDFSGQTFTYTLARLYDEVFSQPLLSMFAVILSDFSGNVLNIIILLTPLSLIAYYLFWKDPSFSLRLKQFTACIIVAELLFLFLIRKSLYIDLFSIAAVLYPLMTFFIIKYFDKYKIPFQAIYAICILNILLALKLTPAYFNF